LLGLRAEARAVTRRDAGEIGSTGGERKRANRQVVAANLPAW
jgi:hypothetical protein